jgi:hypothetical protein
MVTRIVVTICLSVALFVPVLGSAQPNDAFGLRAALSRVPQGEWDTIAFTDLSTTMFDLGETWTPDLDSTLTRGQQEGLAGIWRPEIFSLELDSSGFSSYSIEQVVEARRGNNYVLWLEGRFAIADIGRSLVAIGYTPITDFPAEAYRATSEDKWEQLIPYISLPDGHTILIASNLEYLLSLLDVYDGLSKAMIAEDNLLDWLTGLSSGITSGVLRFDQSPEGCLVESSRAVLHGLRHQDDSWQYVLTVVYPSEVVLNDIRPLSDGLEFSTFRVPNYTGVLGQHTRINEQNLYEDNVGSLIQFVSVLRPDPNMQHLPIDLARQRDTCVLFTAPPASASSLALAFLPDLSGGRLDVDIHFGNVEQALYNAGIDKPLPDPLSDLSESQRASLNSTWRTSLSSEPSFAEWFGFSPDAIYQAAELSTTLGEYARVIWGDFSTADVEASLQQTGYVAVEQYGGTRVFTLREAPTSGGILLSSLAQTVASPQDGMLVFTNQVPNMRLTLDIVYGTFRSPLPRLGDLMLMTRTMSDASNVTLRRYATPPSGGLVCGLPPYRVEGFANVLRPDGWHFFYSLSTNRPWENAEEVGGQLATVLENSDYPLQGPGSDSFGQLSSVADVQVIRDGDAAVILVDLKVKGTDQQASFFGQDLANATLPPCALGDITQ